MDDKNVVLLDFFKSPFVVDIHELIMIAISKIFLFLPSCMCRRGVINFRFTQAYVCGT